MVVDMVQQRTFDVVSLWLNPILLYSSLKDLFFLLKPAQLSLIIVKYNDIDMQYLFKKSKKSKEV